MDLLGLSPRTHEDDIRTSHFQEHGKWVSYFPYFFGECGFLLLTLSHTVMNKDTSPPRFHIMTSDMKNEGHN